MDAPTTTHIRPKFNELWEIWLGGERVTVELVRDKGQAQLKVVAPPEVMIRRVDDSPEGCESVPVDPAIAAKVCAILKQRGFKGY